MRLQILLRSIETYNIFPGRRIESRIYWSIAAAVYRRHRYDETDIYIYMHNVHVYICVYIYIYTLYIGSKYKI